MTRDGHLWCQDKDCPAERGFRVLDYGDYIGDLKVTRLVRVWRTAALYEAVRGEQPVLVKLAHAGPECQDRLKREALLQQSLGDTARPEGGLTAAPRPLRLQLLPPYPTPSRRPFGEITLQAEPRVYAVYRPVAGRLLRDQLLETPQLWHSEAAWITLALAQALQPLSGQGKLHLGLTPDLVLVEQDSDGHWRPTLLDLGWVLTPAEAAGLAGLGPRLEPAYAAPELLAPNPPAAAFAPAADVYSLGLIYFEMLAGHPGFEPRLRRDDQVKQAVAQTREALPVERPELEQAGVIGVLERAIAPSGRFAALAEFSRALAGIYGRPPRERRPLPSRTYVLAAMLAALLAAILCGAGFLLAQPLLSA